MAMKLHIGSGPIYLEGWVNIDISDAHKSDICADVLTLDFKEVDVIYSCHFFEHLSYPNDAIKALSLFYNWLRPGGVLRLAVPDLGLAAVDYVMKGDLKFLYGGDFKGYYHKDTPCERFNFFIKAWEHQMCYDFELLKSLLQDGGFETIYKTGANQSQIQNFNHDRFISESLYVEAIK